MPLAEDYDTAAAVFDAAASAAATLIEPSQGAMGSGTMAGGRLTDIVTDELDGAATLLRHIADELTHLAATCRERAEASRQGAGPAGLTGTVVPPPEAEPPAHRGFRRPVELRSR